MKREVCSADIRSLELMPMKSIQSRTGSQCFRSRRTKNETTIGALVLISPRDRTQAHSTSRVRTDFHGTRLGRAALGIALRETIATGGAHRGIVGDCRSPRGAKR